MQYLNIISILAWEVIKEKLNIKDVEQVALILIWKAVDIPFCNL